MSFFQLNNYTALEISGERVSDFLQGQITSDITQTPIKFKTLFCDEKGYVITNAYVIFNDSALIIVKKRGSPHPGREFKEVHKIL